MTSSRDWRGLSVTDNGARLVLASRQPNVADLDSPGHQGAGALRSGGLPAFDDAVEIQQLGVTFVGHNGNDYLGEQLAVSDDGKRVAVGRTTAPSGATAARCASSSGRALRCRWAATSTPRRPTSTCRAATT